MRVFVNRAFAQFSRKNRIQDIDLCAAVADMARGTIDASLGGNVFKQRLTRRGEGKSGGFRVILILRMTRVTFFVHGFAKKDNANIEDDDLRRFRGLAKLLLGLSDDELTFAVEQGKFQEVHCAGEEI